MNGYVCQNYEDLILKAAAKLFVFIMSAYGCIFTVFFKKKNILSKYAKKLQARCCCFASKTY